MLKAKRKAKAAAPVTAFKAFDPDMSCRNFKYEVGKSYEHAGAVELCSAGFHAVTVPFDAWGYYPGSKMLARVSMRGVSPKKAGDDSKIVGTKIKIEATLSLPEWVKAQAETVLSLCNAAKQTIAKNKNQNAAATGDSGHAAATGYSGHAAATGYSGHAAATGYSGHAAATGNSGHAAATGNSGHAAATGDSGHAAATGYSGHAAATGPRAVAAAIGKEATAHAKAGGFVVLIQYDKDGCPCGGFMSAVGVNGIEAGKNYRLDENGALQVIADDLIRRR